MIWERKTKMFEIKITGTCIEEIKMKLLSLASQFCNEAETSMAKKEIQHEKSSKKTSNQETRKEEEVISPFPVDLVTASLDTMDLNSSVTNPISVFDKPNPVHETIKAKKSKLPAKEKKPESVSEVISTGAIDYEIIRKAFQEFAGIFSPTKAREAVESFGVKKISELAESQYLEFLNYMAVETSKHSGK